MVGSVNFPNIGPAGSAGFTMYLVGSQSTTGGNTDQFGIFVDCGNIFNVRVNRDNTNNAVRAAAWATSPAPVANIDNDTFYTIRLRTDNTKVYLSINNGAEVETSNIYGGSFVNFVLSLFATSTNGSSGNKKIAEMWMFTENQSADKITTMETLLRTKYEHY